MRSKRERDRKKERERREKGERKREVDGDERGMQTADVQRANAAFLKEKLAMYTWFTCTAKVNGRN